MGTYRKIGQYLITLLCLACSANAAIVERYFDVTAAGSGDGTSHANRAALFSAGNWSSVITGFNFAGTDSLRARIETGSYTCSQAMVAGLFTNAPTVANPLLLVGADNSGNILTPPDPDWMSAQPAWDATSLPIIATTTNIATINLGPETVQCYMLNFTASNRTTATGILQGGLSLYWCQATNSTSNSVTLLLGSINNMYGCVFKMTGTSYDTIINVLATSYGMLNCRFEGNLSATTGNRRGITTTTVSGIEVELCTVINHPGEGIYQASTGTSANAKVVRCTIANNGTGIRGNTAASQTAAHGTVSCMITGNTTGIDGNSAAARWFLSHNRLRNTTNISGIGNWPTDMDNVTTAGSDAAEYVDATNGDFRIKYGSVYWGKMYGAGDQLTGVGFMIQ